MELCGTSPVLLVSFSVPGDMHRVSFSPLLEPQSILHTKKNFPISFFCLLSYIFSYQYSPPMMSFHEACVRLNAVVVYEGSKVILFIPCSPGIYGQIYNVISRLPSHPHSEFFSEPTAIFLSLSHIPSLPLALGHPLAFVSGSFRPSFLTSL